MHVLTHAGRRLMSAELITDPERFDKTAPFLRCRIGMSDAPLDYSDPTKLGQFAMALLEDAIVMGFAIPKKKAAAKAGAVVKRPRKRAAEALTA